MPMRWRRPLKDGSQATAENLDSAYTREQAYWAGKQQRAAATQDRLLRSIYPTSDDKHAAAEEIRQVLDQHHKAKELQR
eukprot:363127-Chlamydomonas_euryale.AAC.4